MLSRLSLENFKLHASTIIEAAPVTVFIGPNNSGKSSLFQALLSLRQAASRGANVFLYEPFRRQATSTEQPYLFPADYVIDLGEFKDVVRRGQQEIRIGVTGTILSEKPLKYGTPLEVGFDVRIRDNRLVYHKGIVLSTYGSLNWEQLPHSAAQPRQLSIQVDGVVINFKKIEDFRLIGFSGLDASTPALPDKQVDLIEFANYVGNAPRSLLGSAHPILPLRGFEEWGYPLPDTPAENLERLTLADRTIALASVLAYDRSMEERLSGWLEELLNIGIRVKLLPGKRVTIWTKRSSQRDVDTLFPNEGTGANQLPFLLVPIGLTPPGETILLSEPEAHLHPKAQSGLVSLLLKIVKKEQRQLFIETHSEHVLHSFFHAVARGDLDRNHLAIYYFESVKDTADVKRLEVDEKGRVEGGLPGFFEHALDELSEFLDALKKT